MKKISINILKFSTLFFLFWILIAITKLYGGDYCSTVYDIFIVPIILFLISINIIILYSIDFKKKKYKITNYVLLFSVHILLNYLNSKKETEQKLSVNDDASRTHRVYLYKDKTYEFISNSPHVICHYFGTYNLENNYLLFDKDMNQKIAHQISKKYKLNIDNMEFESIESGFPNLIKEN